jgi:hypothetical protein
MWPDRRLVGVRGQQERENYPETEESGQFWRSTMLDTDTRMRVARGIAKTETEASIEVFQTLKRLGGPGLQSGPSAQDVAY